LDSAPPDTTAPETKIDRSQLRVAIRSATFWFSAGEIVQGFRCQLDKGDYKPCGSPRTYKHLQRGGHTFRVKAVDVACPLSTGHGDDAPGNADGSPAVAHFRIPPPYRGRR